MSLVIHTIPQLLFSSDFPDVEITTTASTTVYFAVHVGSSVVMGEKYVADYDGNVTVRGLNDIINETMEANGEQTSMVQVKAGETPSSLTTVTTRVIYSRYHIIGTTVGDFLSSHFLRRGEVSQTTRTATETLRYYCDESYTETMQIVGMSLEGETETVTVTTSRAAGVVEIDASYATILDLFEDIDTLASYRISIDDRVAFYYVIDIPMYEFTFRNMFGYSETCRLQGVFTKNFTTEKSFATANGRQMQYDVSHEMTMTIDSSAMNLLDIEIFMDMATSDEVTYLGEPALIVEYECNPSNHNGTANKVSVEFEFANNRLAAYLGESGRVFTEEFTKQYY